jgi:ABC-type lipoprotein release transport system permease subunit
VVIPAQAGIQTCYRDWIADRVKQIMILLKLAWRNIFRNKRRTILSGIAIGIGLASLIFTDALMIGMKESMIRSATGTFLGQAQIHAKGFRETLEVEKTIHDLDDVTMQLNNDPAVNHYAVRTQAFGMITSPANVSSVIFYGIEPEMEKHISKIDDAIRKGSYLAKDTTGRLLIGSRLADTMEVDVDDRVVITTAQATTGELSQEMFRIGGIFRFNVKEMDSGMVFMNLEKARSILGLGNNAHEIAVTFHDIDQNAEILSFQKKYSRNGNEALGWRDLLKELDAVLKLSDFSKYIIALILFGIVALIILNTLFTSLYERLFEFGVLRAIGTRPSRLASIVLMEALSLSAVSALFGIITGLVATYIFSKYGIDYRGIEFAEVTFRELIYPVMTINQYIEYPVWIMFFSLVAGLYPALFAARLVPARVLRRSM